MSEKQFAEHKKFLQYVEKRGTVRIDLDPCWLCLNRSLGSHGYPQVTVCGKTTLAHRYSFWAYNGGIELEKRKHICHKCDNKMCCNPAHLYQGTPKDNMADVIERGIRPKAVPKPVIRNSKTCKWCIDHHKKCETEAGATKCKNCIANSCDCEIETDRERGRPFSKELCGGENNVKAILTWDQVREIRRRKEAGLKYGELKKMAEEYGIVYGTIQRIVGGTLWKE